MAKEYLLQFGNGNPTLRTGLSPTLVVFKQLPSGTGVAAPGITEVPTATGLYYFTYGPTGPISFVVDGGASISDAGARYITGALDPLDAVDEKIGTTSDSIGSTSVDPTTLYGYLKRLQEFNEGNSTFNKTSGAWAISARGATVIANKTLTDSAGVVTKS